MSNGEIMLVGSDLYKRRKDQVNPEVQRVKNEYDRATMYWDKDADRSIESWKLYWAVDPERGMGQWPAAVVQRMMREGRHLAQFNLISPKVDNLAGAMHRNPFDAKFIPVDAAEAKDSSIIQDLYYSDKEMMDWKQSDLYCSIHGLIHQGVEQIKISDRYSKLGNIGFDLCLPGHVVFDPAWKSINAKDCKKAWKTSYLNAEEIKETYGKVSERVEMEIELMERYGTEFGTNYGVTPQEMLREEKNGDRYKIIEQYYMRKEAVKREEILTIDGYVALPETDDREYKSNWLDENHPHWRNNSRLIREEHDMKDFCYVMAICPQLSWSMVLSDGKIEEQVGRLPFFPYSAYRQNGECRGVVEAMKDAQQTLNYRESLVTHMIQTNATGAKMVDPALFNNNRAQLDSLKANANHPGFWIETKPGALMKSNADAIRQINKPIFDSNVTAQLERMMTIMDRITPSSAVSESRENSSAPSGILYQAQVKQAEQTQFVLYEGRRQHVNDKAEAYLELAPQVYSNEGLRRVFPRNDGTKTIINAKDTNGNITNDIRKMPRNKVVISESPEGDTNRLTTRAVANDLLKAIPETSAATRQELVNAMVKTIDQFDDEDKKKLEVIGDLELNRAIASVKADTAILEQKAAEAQAQTASINAQMGAQVPQEELTGGPQTGPPPMGAPPPQANPEQVQAPTPPPNGPGA